MRIYSKLLATASNAGVSSNLLSPRPLAILPPIPLYRRILRSHRKLPTEQRTIGDLYVKAEFRAHREVENPVHIIGFLTEWQMYAQQIEGDYWRGGKLDKSKVDKMSDEQIAQLYELMQAIRKQELEENDPEFTPEEK